MNLDDNENKTVVLLGSLGVSYEKWLPYATGCLISHCQRSVQLGDHRFESPLYKTLSKQDLHQRLSGVDVLGLTCYVWNQSANTHISNVFRQINPGGIVVWGGPNIPRSRPVLERFASQFQQVDHFVHGMGETAFRDLLVQIKKHKFSGGPAPERLFQSGENSLLPEDRGNPYLDGVFDSILDSDNNLKASFESNRGCPYKCTFCDWGGQAGSRIQALEMEEVEKVIDFLYSKNSIREIEILDANFGMFRRDREIIDLMVQYKRKHGTNPSVSYSGLAKNGSPFLPEIIKVIESELNSRKHQLKISFQSHSEQTLAANHRENIRNEKLISLMTELRKDGPVDIASELIIGLPDDTPERFLETLSRDIALGISNSRAYILSVSENTTLKDPEFVEKHDLKFKTVRFPDYFREWPRKTLFSQNAQQSLPEPESFEEHTLVRQSKTLNLKAMKTVFLYWWFHHTFYNSGGLSETLRFLEGEKLGYPLWMDDFIEATRNQPVLSEQVRKMETMVETIFSPEPVTTFFDFETYVFMSGPLRTLEIHEILNHSGPIKNFLLDFFSQRYPSEPLRDYLNSDLNSWKSQGDRASGSDLGLLARLKIHDFAPPVTNQAADIPRNPS